MVGSTLVSPAIYESDVEELALAQLAALGYDCINGEDIAPEQPAAEFTLARVRWKLHSRVVRAASSSLRRRNSLMR